MAFARNTVRAFVAAWGKGSSPAVILLAMAGLLLVLSVYAALTPAWIPRPFGKDS